MKKTLTLLALVAALMPMMPHAAKAEIKLATVTGVSIDTSDPSKSTGIFDADKTGYPFQDSGLCWAATCSNLIAWWEVQNADTLLPNTPTEHQQIWDRYRLTFQNFGGDIAQGLDWWLTGDYAKGEDKELKPWLGDYVNGMKTLSPADAGFYQESLWRGEVDKLDIYDLIPAQHASVQAFSMALVSAINQGYGVGLSWVYPSIFEGQPPTGHAVTVWGAEYDTQTNLLTALYLTDSDNAHKEEGLVRVEITAQGNTFVETARPSHSIESFTLLNSTLISDLNYFNYQDKDNHNIIMKQKLNGEGYTLTEGTQEVNDIIFDNSRGTQDRLLTVEGEHAAETLYVNGSGSNTIDVTKGGELVVEQITGGQNLTKTGEGALEIKGGTHTGSMDIQAGDVHNFGKLGDVTLANGGSLVNEGTTGELTVGKGSVAKIVRSAANSQDGVQAFTLCTVEEGGVLTGSGKFGQVVLKEGSTLKVGNGPGVQAYQDSLSVYAANLVFTIDDASSWRNWAKVGEEGWNSGTYSTIEMNGNALTLKNPEFTMALGSDILERAARTDDLDNVLGMNIYITMDLRLIAGVNSMSDPYKVYEGYEDFYKNTHFMLSEDDAELVAKGLEATFTPVNMSFYVNGQELYMQTGLNVTLAKAPVVPEPTTSTLSLLALASLCARRRRK